MLVRIAIFCCFNFWGYVPLCSQNNPIASEWVNTEDAIITTLYEVISGPAGQKRDWDLMRALFHPDARLMAMSKDQKGNNRLVPMTLERYIERGGRNLEENGFFEEEVSRQTDRFGGIVQVFSTYTSKRTLDGPVFQRGINSIQLIWQDNRYYIVNILWDSERDDQPIPKKYLKKRKQG